MTGRYTHDFPKITLDLYLKSDNSIHGYVRILTLMKENWSDH